MGGLWEVGISEFLFVTVFLGGGAAYLSGRSVALTWRPVINVVVYALGLNFAVRFIHYALFNGSLLTLQYFLTDLVVLLALAALGFRLTQTSQMVGRYSWLYEQQSPLSWRPKNQAGRSGGSP